MNRLSLQTVLCVAPVLVLGMTSCSSMNQTKARLAEWKEKREERQMAREVAMAEKELAEEAGAADRLASATVAEPIFLDYSNPDGSLTGALLPGDGPSSSYGAAPLLPGADLPVMIDLASGSMEAPGGDPIFLADGTASESPTPAAASGVDVDLVRAWAASISPLMGASLTEPLITAAMTAQPTSTESAVAAHSAATDAAPLASAFAGQPARASLRPVTSELEHE
jgi:hypothetical protein